MQPSPYDTFLSPEDVSIPSDLADLPPLAEETELASQTGSRHAYEAYRPPHVYQVYGRAYQHYGKPHYPHHAEHRHRSFSQFPAVQQTADRPLRLIHAGPNLVRGGAEQWFLDLVRFLDPRRIQVLRTIATWPFAIDPDLVADLRVPVEIGYEDSFRRAAHDCDILLSWGIALDDLLGDVRAKLCVVVVHGEGAWNRDYLDGSRAALDHVVAVCHAVKLRNCAGYPTSVIYNGVDRARLAHTRSREEVRAMLGFQPGDFVLGFVGRFAPEKRADRILDAVAMLPPRFKALLVGWGDARPSLLDYAKTCIPGRHAFATAWDYLGDYYQAMDAFCLVSTQEGFPLALLEAMMWGLPAIVTPVGCVPEVLRDRVNALIVPGDAASIAQAAAILQARPRWAAGLAREAQFFAEQYGHARRMARDYETLFHGLWHEKHGPRA